jgi:hypothetical protein
MKRLVLFIFKALAGMKGCAQDEGTCGEHLTWTLDENGTLTIRGTGVMTDFTDFPFGGKVSPAPWYASRDRITAVVVEPGVENIGNYVFYCCRNLASVELPASLTSIGMAAFNRCSSLASVKIPEKVTSIGEYAFLSCSSLASVTLPASLTSIGIAAFNRCSSLASVKIPEKVASIGAFTFDKCSSLASVEFPASLTYIESTAFNDCSSLTEIAVASDNPVFSSEAGVLLDKNKATLLLYPKGKTDNSYIIPASVTTIGYRAFDECSRLASVTLPASVTLIVQSALSGCSGLTEIAVASDNPVFSSEAGILFDKDKATLLLYPARKADNSYIVPASATSIGRWAFGDCSRQASVTLPASLTFIGEYAFYGCSSLADITVNGITPPAISSYAFSGLTKSNITLHVPQGTKAAYAAAAFWREFHIVERAGCYSGAFGAGNSLTWMLCDGILTISGTGAMPEYDSSLQVISGAAAAPNLPPWHAYRDGITDVVIEAGITAIGSGSFEGCDHLTDITVN